MIIPIDPALAWPVRALSFFITITLLWLGLTVLLNAERKRDPGTWVAGGSLVLGGLIFAGHSAVIGRNALVVDAELGFWLGIGWTAVIAGPFLWYAVMAWYGGRLRKAGYRALLWALAGLGVVVTALPPIASLVYAGVCSALAVESLRASDSSNRFMGDLARQRARPWLRSASFVLLLAGLSIAAVSLWFLKGIESWELRLSAETLRLLLVSDLVILTEIALAVVFIGRAVVSYEVFTGKTLPRQGLYKQWRNSLVLAAAYGGLVGGVLSLPVEPVYPLLVGTLLLALCYALLGWRSFEEREETMARLRGLGDTDATLATLCDDVLGARVGYLIPTGALAPPVAYPSGTAPTAPERLDAEICVPIDPAVYGGASWAVPLGNGALLLGPKRDGGLYTREEMEVARQAAERLIEARASAELARRLVALQRQRLAESQVADQGTRRALHDDVLPRLHAAMLTLHGRENGAAETLSMLTEVHQRLAGLLQSLPATLAPEVGRIGLLPALRQAVAAERFDRVEWQITKEAELTLVALPPLTAEVLFCAAREAVRNAAKHGGRRLTVTLKGCELTVSDDGPGFTREAGADGSGQGLALHTTLMAVIGGSLRLESSPTRVVLSLPES